MIRVSRGHSGRSAAAMSVMATPPCPVCGSADVRLGAVDRIHRTVRHRCRSCEHGWVDDFLDLIEVEIAAGAVAEARATLRRSRR